MKKIRMITTAMAASLCMLASPVSHVHAADFAKLYQKPFILTEVPVSPSTDPSLSPTVTDTLTPTAALSPTNTPTPTAAPLTSTPTPTAAPTTPPPTNTPTPTAVPSTNTPTPTAAPPTNTPTPTPTAAPPTNTPTPTPKPTPTPTPTRKISESLSVYNAPVGNDLKIIISGKGRIYLNNRYAAFSILNTTNKSEIARLNSYGIRLPKGEYLIHNLGWGYTFDSSTLGSYISFIADTGYTEEEFNDSLETADPISTNTEYAGNFNTRYDVDVYKVYLPYPCTLNVKLTSAINKPYQVAIYQESTYRTPICRLDTELRNQQSTNSIQAAAGTYYIKFSVPNYSISSTDDYCSEYLFKIITSSGYNGYNGYYGYSESEYNDTYLYATSMPANVAYSGSISSSSDVDYYRISINSECQGQLLLSSPNNSYSNLFQAKLIRYNNLNQEVIEDTLYSSGTSTNYGNQVHLQAGTYYIRVASGNNSYYSSTNYTIQLQTTSYISASSISLSSNQKEFTVGDYATVTASVSPSNATNKNITWSSSNIRVATIDSNGKLHCLAPGTTTIRAVITNDSKVYRELSITVKSKGEVRPTWTPTPTPTLRPTPTPTSRPISRNHYYETVYVGDNYNLDFEYDDGLNLTYVSSNRSIATVNYLGKVTFLRPGTVSITAECTNKFSDEYTFTVKGEKSSNTGLKKIKATTGKITKSSNTLYKITLSKNQSSVRIAAVTSDQRAKYKINGKSVKTLKLSVSRKRTKTASVQVIAENGSKKTYTVKIYRK